MDQKSYAVLGIHELEPVLEQVTNADGSVQTVERQPAVTVARVRMFIGDKAVDEDLVMPRIITVEEQLQTATAARIAELQKGIPGDASELVTRDGDQIILDKPPVPLDIVPATPALHLTDNTIAEGTTV